MALFYNHGRPSATVKNIEECAGVRAKVTHENHGIGKLFHWTPLKMAMDLAAVVISPRNHPFW